MKERPGPDGEDHDAEHLVRVDLLVLEGVEELDDVGRGADVDEQELRELVAGEVSLGQHPPPDDEDQHEELLDNHHQSVVIHGDGDVLEVDGDLG